MTIDVDRAFIFETLEELVACDSVNPAFSDADGRPGRGEREIAELAARQLAEAGLEVTLYEATAGRPSVVGRLRGEGGGRALMLNGHLDTVAAGGMRAPFTPTVEDDRLHGRGAYDMKSGVAAALGAARAVAQSGARLAGDLLVALVADEEEASLGTSEVLTQHRPDAAIVTEPTDLRVCIAHKGFTWLRLVTRGRACHGSDAEHGVDANLRMAAVLGAVAAHGRDLRGRTGHPLLGAPSIHAPLLSGGAGPSIYSPRCTAQLERRTVPGETPQQIVREVESVVAGLGEEVPGEAVSIEEVLSRRPFEGSGTTPLRTCVDSALEATGGRPAKAAGVQFWTDAALLQAAGADTVVFGPAGEGAHADVEWVDLPSVETCARVLAETALRFCSGPRG